MSVFTQKEKELLKNRFLEKSRFLSLNQPPEQKMETQKQKIILRKKLQTWQIKLTTYLQKTPLVKEMGLSARQLGAINRGRTDLGLCLRVIKLFKMAMADLYNPAMPSLRGLNLSPAEMKLYMAIWRKKQFFLQMVLSEFAKNRRMALQNTIKKEDELRQKPNAQHLDLSNISMQRYSDSKIYNNQYTEEEVDAVNKELSIYKFSFAEKLKKSRDLEDELKRT